MHVDAKSRFGSVARSQLIAGAGRRRRAWRIRLAALLSVIGLWGCHVDATEPDGDALFELTHVNGTELPAIGVEGGCSFLFGSIFPDTIRVDAGKLTLRERGHYEIWYTWRGQTDACTVFGAHWHRISAGNYRFDGDRLIFISDTAPSYWPTSNRGRAPMQLSGTRVGTDILVDWGALQLRFAR